MGSPSSSRSLRRFSVSLIALLHAVVGLYALVAWPPLHLVFDKVPDPPSKSICVPGSGFSGFWYHMGFIESLNLTDNDTTNQTADFYSASSDDEGHDTAPHFYCFSSGCLSLALAGHAVDDVYTAATSVQDDWLLHKTVSQYEVVGRFLNQTILEYNRKAHMEDCADDDTGDDAATSSSSCRTYRWIHQLLPRLHILISSWNQGVRLEMAESVEELVQLLLQTTYIPFVTGPALLERRNGEDNDLVLDGAFSRMLHPSCDATIAVPLLDRGHLLHALNPAMSKESVWMFWEDGKQAAKESSFLQQT